MTQAAYCILIDLHTIGDVEWVDEYGSYHRKRFDLMSQVTSHIRQLRLLGRVVATYDTPSFVADVLRIERLPRNWRDKWRPQPCEGVNKHITETHETYIFVNDKAYMMSLHRHAQTLLNNTILPATPGETDTGKTEKNVWDIIEEEKDV